MNVGDILQDARDRIANQDSWETQTTLFREKNKYSLYTAIIFDRPAEDFDAALQAVLLVAEILNIKKLKHGGPLTVQVPLRNWEIKQKHSDVLGVLDQAIDKSSE